MLKQKKMCVHILATFFGEKCNDIKHILVFIALKLCPNIFFLQFYIKTQEFRNAFKALPPTFSSFKTIYWNRIIENE